MTTDSLQHALHAAATGQPLLGHLAVFLASGLIAVLAAGFAALVWVYRGVLTRALAVRLVVSGALAVLLALLTGHLIHDPRPFIVDHYTPLAHASVDNGFPSDHTLVAALLAGWVAWLARRWVPVFVLGVLAVLLGRLAIGAHHTLDVVGSVLIAGVALGIAAALPLKGEWLTPLIARRPLTTA
ncbi:undecaprenyl-diphosphatase [Deinococcus metalli]|uniref:Undecaprenyl-diphosphatase n=1 Tax=Deinococcus metalli TaxID=1141878 RepID=A0A7W8NQG0_9DEIO|nr:phosphatase PAP2 family protein [Deinococcus metalli]MBB5379009.1 undecaprenyl-diphosphatase [Deinococcus metalli]GHF63385.1 undecaprenyl-diphosphatase [Deinococcus metalli]